MSGEVSGSSPGTRMTVRVPPFSADAPAERELSFIATNCRHEELAACDGTRVGWVSGCALGEVTLAGI